MRSLRERIARLPRKAPRNFQHRLTRRPIEHQTEVELPRHLQALLDQHPADDAALGTGLMGHELHAEDLARERLGFRHRLRDFHAAALAASAGVDLRLDHDDAAAERLGGLPDRSDG